MLAPTNSPTIAPITERVADIFNAAKMYGKAFGIRNFLRTCQLEAEILRNQSKVSEGIDCNPFVMLTTEGKKHTIPAAATFDQRP